MPRPLRRPPFYFSNIRTKRILCPRRLVYGPCPQPAATCPSSPPQPAPVPAAALPFPLPSPAPPRGRGTNRISRLAGEPPGSALYPRGNGLFVPAALPAHSRALHPAVPGCRRGSRDAARHPLRGPGDSKEGTCRALPEVGNPCAAQGSRLRRG